MEGSRQAHNAHHFYIEPLNQIGVVGLIALLAFTAGWLRALLRTRSGTPDFSDRGSSTRCWHEMV
jgi:hypothetical protein